MATEVSSINSGFHFEKLDGKSNYNDWKFTMEMYLIEKDLWDYVDGTKTYDPTKSKKTYSLIGLAVKTHVYMEIRDLPRKIRKAGWDVLKKRFEDAGFSRKACLIATIVKTGPNTSTKKNPRHKS